MYGNNQNNLNNNLEITDLLGIIGDTLQVINTVGAKKQDEKIAEILELLKEQQQMLTEILKSLKRENNDGQSKEAL